MDMSGERRIPAARQAVWDALNDPDVLKASIPGCETLERTGPDELKATAAVRIGPISARFNGKVKLADLDPPNGYTISGEGQGGVAGFAKGGAQVRLADADDGSTLLSYQVNAQVGGRIAQLGARLVDATAKQMADQFFDRFAAQVAPVRPASDDAVHAVQDPHAPPVVAGVATARDTGPARISILSMIPEEPFGLPRIAWLGIAAFGVIFIMLFSPYLTGR
jgi:hypothetical protein